MMRSDEQIGKRSILGKMQMLLKTSLAFRPSSIVKKMEKVGNQSLKKSQFMSEIMGKSMIDGKVRDQESHELRNKMKSKQESSNLRS